MLQHTEDKRNHRVVTLKELESVKDTKYSKAGRNHVHIKHYDFYQMILQALDKHKLSVKDEPRFVLNEKKYDMFGEVIVTKKITSKYVYTIGFVNSNSRKTRIYLYPSISDAQSLYGICCKKIEGPMHICSSDIESGIADCVAACKQWMTDVLKNETLLAYENRPERYILNQSVADHLFVLAAKKTVFFGTDTFAVLQPSHITKASEAFETCCHGKHSYKKESKLNLYAAFAEALSYSSSFYHIERFYHFQEIVNTVLKD